MLTAALIYIMVAHLSVGLLAGGTIVFVMMSNPREKFQKRMQQEKDLDKQWTELQSILQD